jgi:putative ABC transport system permease protein
MTFWWRIAFREISNSGRYSFAVIMSIAVGLAGFGTVNIFSQSFQNQLQKTSLQTTGAEFLASANQPLIESDLASIRQFLAIEQPHSRRVSFFTMVSAADETRLVLVNAIDENYPIRGRFVTDVDLSSARLQAEPIALLDPELSIQLQVKPGDSLQIGQMTFRIAGNVTEDSSAASMGFNVAPRAYIGAQFVAQTGLVQIGSRIRYDYLLPKLEATPHDRVAFLSLKKNFNDPLVRLNHHSRQSEQLGRLINNVTDFLKLMSLVGLLMGGIGCWFLIRSFIDSRTEEVAILKCLGASKQQVTNIFAGQLVILAGLAATLAVIASFAFASILPVAFAGLLPADFSISIDWSAVAITYLVALTNIALFAFPALNQLHQFKPVILLRGATERPTSTWRRTAGWMLAQMVAYWAFACYVVRSYFTGSIFIAALVLTIGISLGGFRAMAFGFQRLPRIRNLIIRLPIIQILRLRAPSVTAFVCISLCGFFLNLPFQIGKTLSQQVSTPDGVQDRPDLFLFDIQDEQTEGLTELLARRQLQLGNLSPLVRARLLKINGQPADSIESGDGFRTREAEQEEFARNRTYNLSSRESLASSETMVDGRPFSSRYQGNDFTGIEFSLEKEFAGRLGVTVGDRLTFDLQGVEMEGPVINLRQVKWTSFQPNFFVIVQPGVLDDAPKSYLAGIAGVDSGAKSGLQRDIVRQFLNISLIDVTKTTQRITDLASQIQRVITIMSLMTSFAALSVLMAIALQGLRARTQIQTILKVLGLSAKKLQRMTLVEFLVMSGTGSMLGAILAMIINIVLSHVAFSSYPVLDFVAFAAVCLAVPILTSLTGFLTVRRSFDTPARVLLAEN